MIKKYYFLYLFIAVSFTQTTVAQEVSQRDIKRSNLYYYYQSFEKNVEFAKETARKGLMSLVSREVLETTNISNISEVHVNKIQYFVLPLQEETKVIAYVLKTDVINNAGGKEFTVVVVKDMEKVNDKKIKTPQIVSLETKPPPIIIESKSNKKKKGIIKNKKIKETQVESFKKNKGLSTLEQLISCDTDIELYKYLRKYNFEGKLRYSWDSKKYQERASITNHDIVLIDKDTKKIVAYFEKSNKTDLKNNKQINQFNFNNYIQVWIEMY